MTNNLDFDALIEQSVEIERHERIPEWTGDIPPMFVKLAEHLFKNRNMRDLPVKSYEEFVQVKSAWAAAARHVGGSPHTTAQYEPIRDPKTGKPKRNPKGRILKSDKIIAARVGVGDRRGPRSDSPDE